MVNGIRTIDPCELNNGFGLKFWMASRVRHEIFEEGLRTDRLKLEYNNEDEDNSAVL